MMNNLIDRQAAIDAIWSHATKILEGSDYDIFIQDIYKMTHRHIAEVIRQLPSAQPEPLTDKEQRIFLAAMSREEKVCKQVDDEYRDCKDSLVSICNEITRKVKGALWTV